MNKTMIMTRSGILLALALSSQAMATTSLDVTFTATLRETTCDMKIEGGTGDGSNNTIPIGTAGTVQVNDIVDGSDAATANFKLKITECPASLTSLKTTITGSASTYNKSAIVNTASSGAANYLGVTIARTSAPTAPFEINSTDDNKLLLWTGTEINTKEVPLIARLVETQPGKSTAGAFSATATFNFIYE